MPEATEELRVVIADDHPVVRAGLITLLTALPGITVVAEAGDGAEAIRCAEEHRPDVVVMDLRMPGIDGVEATRRIRSALPEVAVLVLTMFDEDLLVERALSAGARGYLLKGADGAVIARALHSVARGDAVLARDVADRVIARVATPTAARPDFALSPRESEVLERIARGHANARIAAELHLAPKTIANHISAIFAKLGVATRAEAIVIAREAGFGSGRD